MPITKANHPARELTNRWATLLSNQPGWQSRNPGSSALHPMVQCCQGHIWVLLNPLMSSRGLRATALFDKAVWNFCKCCSIFSKKKSTSGSTNGNFVFHEGKKYCLSSLNYCWECCCCSSVLKQQTRKQKSPLITVRNWSILKKSLKCQSFHVFRPTLKLCDVYSRFQV